ncbi:MAG: hydroxyacid dehydrogenase [Gammaproteobacteria bacterium]|uniref:Hydroxyacid dehydrogenase n=1 Tax=OM182 bacterium MED-G24 TaxID=1986255 RepID=A0A2A5WU53_9GAMM|nr:hydroxyacid dehydrogenase [Gammaproteobacteria bacterium]PDH39734.1 MAG: hydroxyacid dehydrogenase [OM182 bacterium MED-G24]RPG27422.1 MAG: D-2-hydroxyacid dehydrogenase [Gammaproteobacteria bacterium TMED50]|tara:strand:- start:2069 stop:3034 length:966 start_codon:yes stop_codon:yes gene_type:complete
MKVMVIPGLTLAKVPDEALQEMRDVVGTDGEVIVCSYDEAHTHAVDVDVILGFVPLKLFAATNRLRWVQSISSGVDSFMYPEFINSDVVLTSEKGLVGEHLADHGFGLLLMLTRQLAAARDLGPDGWNHRPELRAQEVELTGLNMGIIGFGGTGRAMSRRAAAFGLNVRSVDRDPLPASAEVSQVEGTDRLHDMLGWSDVLAICCPLTEETDRLINADTLGQLKSGAFIVNVTRGEVIDEDALLAALKSGHVRGAGLDVVPREPLPSDSELWQLPNVVMTPHTAGASQYRAQRNLDRFIDNLDRFIRSEPLVGVVDKMTGY